MTTPTAAGNAERARLITPEDQPVFSPATGLCWLYDAEPIIACVLPQWSRITKEAYDACPSHLRSGWTHWHPDQPTAPTCTPQAALSPGNQPAGETKDPYTQFAESVGWIKPPQGLAEKVAETIKWINLGYLWAGGNFNPELANHRVVSDKLREIRDLLTALAPYVTAEPASGTTIHPGHLKKGISSDSRCMQDLRALNKPYPRTCEECGLGPCKRYPKSSAQPAPSPAREEGANVRDAAWQAAADIHQFADSISYEQIAVRINEAIQLEVAALLEKATNMQRERDMMLTTLNEHTDAFQQANFRATSLERQIAGLEMSDAAKKMMVENNTLTADLTTARQQLAEARAEGERLKLVILEHAKGKVQFHGALVGEDIVQAKTELATLHALASELAGVLEKCDKAFANWQVGQIPGRPEDILALITEVRSSLLAFRSSTPAPAPAPDKPATSP